MKADIIKLLEQQTTAPSVGSGLPMMSLWSKVVYKVTFFTLVSDQMTTHYSEPGRFRFHCLGDGCPACAPMAVRRVR